MLFRLIDMTRLALLLPLALSACTPPPPPAPPLPPPPPAAVAPAPLPSGDWRDWPITPGSWRYVPGSPTSSAHYGEPQAPQFVVRCDKTARQVTIMRAGTATELAITTSTRTARFPVGHIDEQWTLPLGVRARLDADSGEVSLLEPAVA